MARFVHHRLPDYSTLLAGHTPRDVFGFPSPRLQIWYNHTHQSWVGNGEAPHCHTRSDECFVVLRGALVVEVGGTRHTIGPREYCCFPPGLYHAVAEVHPPVETLMIRAPSVNDKQTMYTPNPNSAYRVKFDFRVDFTNGGHVEGQDFLLDLEGDSVSDVDLKAMIVESMNLARAGTVTIFKKQVVRRGEHGDAAP